MISLRSKPTRWFAALSIGVLALVGCGGADETTTGGAAGEPSAGNAGPVQPGAAAAAERSVEAVLLVTIDGLRRDELAPYGGESGHSPRLADLSRSGVTFMDVSSSSIDPAAALMSALSGLHPAAHGVTAEGTASAAHPDLPRLAPSLKAAGWHTAALFSAGAAGLADLGFGAGFDTVAPVGGGPGEPLRKAAEFVRAGGAGPAFLWVHVDALRDPNPGPEGAALVGLTPERLAEPDAAGLVRAATLAQIDAALGDLALTLVETGASARALMLVAGVAPTPTAVATELGELGAVVNRAVSTGLIAVAREGLATAGHRSLRPIASVDIAPTILELAGVAAPLGTQGRSFVADFTGQLEWAGPVWIDTGGRPSRAAALRWGGFEFAADEGGRRRLHDLRAAPDSAADVSAARPREASTMADWMGRIEAECAALRGSYPATSAGS